MSAKGRGVAGRVVPGAEPAPSAHDTTGRFTKRGKRGGKSRKKKPHERSTADESNEPGSGSEKAHADGVNGAVAEQGFAHESGGEGHDSGKSEWDAPIGRNEPVANSEGELDIRTANEPLPTIEDAMAKKTNQDALEPPRSFRKLAHEDSGIGIPNTERAAKDADTTLSPQEERSKPKTKTKKSKVKGPKKEERTPPQTYPNAWDEPTPEDDATRSKGFQEVTSTHEAIPTESDSENDGYGSTRTKPPFELALASTRAKICAWIAADPKTSGRWKNCSRILQSRLSNHLAQRYNHISPPEDVSVPPEDEADWQRQLRTLLWRAVIRANYFWTDPSTGAGGRPKPVAVPEGVHAGRFDVFVVCCAERADRVGRDLPTAAWVNKIEGEVRELFVRVERAGEEGRRALEKLAFMLCWDEELKLELGVMEVRERVRRAFAGVRGVGFAGLEYVTKGEVAKVDTRKAVGSSVMGADLVWGEFETWVKGKKTVYG